MSKFDRLSLEIISRPSISDNERLGLAELQLQRAQRMNWLLMGDNKESNDTVQHFTSVRDENLETLQVKRNAEKKQKQDEAESKQLTELFKRQQELEKLERRGSQAVEDTEKPSQKDVSAKTPTPAATPTEKETNSNTNSNTALSPQAPGAAQSSQQAQQ